MQIIAMEKMVSFRHLPNKRLHAGDARRAQSVLALLVWRKTLFCPL